MKKTLLIIYDQMALGGIETHILNMSKWCKLNGHRMIWGKTKFVEGEKKSVEELINNGVEVLELKRIMKNRLGNCNCYDMSEYELTLAEDEELLILSVDYFGFMLGEGIKRNFRNKIDNVFWVTHEIMAYRDVEIAMQNKNFIIEKSYYLFYRRIANKLAENKNIVHLSDIAMETFIKHYNLKITTNELSFLGLGLFLDEFDLEEVKCRYRNDVTNITTIGRFDFPFKAYVLGIIDSFKKIREQGYNVKLNIIGYGKDEETVISKISELPIEIQDHIQLLGKVDYRELSKYLSNTNIYIGTGMTLVDAANKGIPGIIATVYQSGDVSGGFLCYNMMYPMSYIGNSTFTEDILKVLKMTENEYVELSQRTYDEYKKAYDINIHMPILFGFRNKSEKATISRITINFVCAVYVLGIIIKRIKKVLFKSSGINFKTKKILKDIQDIR